MCRRRNFLQISGRLIVCTIVFGSFSAVTFAGEILEIRQQVAVAGDQLYLQDLVVNSDSISSAEKKTPVMSTPPMGEKKHVSLTDIAYKLQKYPSLLDKKIRGADNIVIERTVDWKKVEDKIKTLKELIRQKEAWSDWEIKISFSRSDYHRLSEITGDDLQVNLVDGDKLLGEVPLYVSSSGKGNQQRIAPVIKRRADRLVLNKNKKRGEALTENDVKTVETWIRKTNDDAVQNIEQCVGREINRNLSEGRMLKDDYLSEPLYAERGDLVVVNCEYQNLRVKVNVRALETGRKGERIKVRNPESSKVFSVKLVGRRQAALKF